MHDYFIAGVDLAWVSEKNPTAIAVGKVSASKVELFDVSECIYGIQSVIDTLGKIKGLQGVAIDAPLVIKNPTGQRECERNISEAYGARKAACHSSNLRKFPDSTGVRLSLNLTDRGFQFLAEENSRWQLECYPHPALIEIFDLPERLAYKKGSVSKKRTGQIELGNLLGSLKTSPVLPLHIEGPFSRYLSEDHINDLRGKKLKHNEDVLDAIVCMYIGALYQSGQPHKIFGRPEDGAICVPMKRCI